MKESQKKIIKEHEVEVDKITELVKSRINAQLFELIDGFSSPEKPFIEFELTLMRNVFEIARICMEKLIPILYGTQYKGPTVRLGNETLSCLNQNKSRNLKTIFGKIKIDRAYYHNESSGTGKSFLDERLDIEYKKICPTIRYWSNLLGVTMPFNEASTVLKKITGTTLSKSDIEAYTESLAQGVTRRHELEIQDIEEDENGQIKPAKITTDNNSKEVVYFETDGCHVPTRKNEEGFNTIWKECKTFLLFQKEDGEDAKIVNKNYYSTMQPIEIFKRHVKINLEKYCKNKKIKLVCIGDGAPWIWNMLDEVVPGDKTKILDWYHIMEHVGGIGEELYKNEEEKKVFVSHIETLLWSSKTDKAIETLRDLYAKQKSHVRMKRINDLIEYIEKNKERMDYARYKKEGLVIGSGAIESGNKYVIQRRLKLSGIRWYVKNADYMAHLRAEYINDKFDALFKLKNNPLASIET